MGLSFSFPPHGFIFSSFPCLSLHQSIFMFPLSFSSSSSLSSIPPSLDSISELDRGLSDISEDDDLVDDSAASRASWAPPSYASVASEQQWDDSDPHAPLPPTCSPARASEAPAAEESRLDEPRAASEPLTWRSWLSVGGAVRYVSLVLCFLSVLGKSGKSLPAKLFSGLKKKLSVVTLAVSRLVAQSVGNLKMFTLSAPRSLLLSLTQSRLRQSLSASADKLHRSVAFFASCLPTKLCALPPAQLSLPSVSSPCAVSPFSSHLLSLLTPSSSSSRSNLTASVRRYLLKPSPLFLPCLLVLFLLVVMLTASQSLLLALVLATPLGLTLCYLENMASGQRKAALPVFASGGREDQLSSGLSRAAPSLTPPRSRHHAHAAATWTLEMCDPAA